MSDELRLQTLGFQVTAYKVDDEFNAPVFKAGTEDKSIPLTDRGGGFLHRRKHTTFANRHGDGR
ncbi:MAG: hypothetical protein R3E42_07880 [Burkholderiaceae bacterium]